MEIIACFITAVAIYLMIQKNKWGFMIFNIANIFWIYLDYKSGMYFRIGVEVFFTVFNFYGFYKWKKDEKK